MVASCCHEAQRSLILSAATAIEPRNHSPASAGEATRDGRGRMTTTDMTDALFLRACRRQPVERTPVWMMRQAGRYLPSYRAVRARASFLEMCRTPALACEVTLQPIDELGFDAAILFSDILITLPAMGIDVAFPEAGPKIGAPVRTSARIAQLAEPDPEAELPFVMESVR